MEIVLQGDAPSEFAVWLPAPNPRLCPFLMLEPPREGESYLISADFCGRRMLDGAEGKRDTNAIGVWKAEKIDKNGKTSLPQLVCSLKGEDRSATVETIRRIKCMALLYGNCMVVPETNNKDDIAERLEAEGLRIWRQGVTGADGAEVGKGKTQEILGFATFGNKKVGGPKKRIIDHLEEMISEQRFIAGLPWVVHQLSVFIVDEDGHLEAASGELDDQVIMTALALFTMGSATPYKDPKMTAVAAKRAFRPNTYDTRD